MQKPAILLRLVALLVCLLVAFGSVCPPIIASGAGHADHITARSQVSIRTAAKPAVRSCCKGVCHCKSGSKSLGMPQCAALCLDDHRPINSAVAPASQGLIAVLPQVGAQILAPFGIIRVIRPSFRSQLSNCVSPQIRPPVTLS